MPTVPQIGKRPYPAKTGYGTTGFTGEAEKNKSAKEEPIIVRFGKPRSLPTHRSLYLPSDGKKNQENVRSVTLGSAKPALAGYGMRAAIRAVYSARASGFLLLVGLAILFCVLFHYRARCDLLRPFSVPATFLGILEDMLVLTLLLIAYAF
jgi:hypothetical protein